MTDEEYRKALSGALALQPAAPPTQPKAGVSDYLALGARGLLKEAPIQFASTISGMIEGEEGAEPFTGRDIGDAIGDYAAKSRADYGQEVQRRLGSGFASEMVQALPDLGYSAATIPFAGAATLAGAGLAGLAGAPAGSIAPAIAGGAAGLAASTVVIDRAARNQILRDLKNAEEEVRGKPFTESEYKAWREEVKDKVAQVGGWNSLPEAAASVFEAAVLSKVPGKSLLKRFAKQALGVGAAELPTEMATSIGESQALEGTALAREGGPLSFTNMGDLATAAREVAPGVLTVSGAAAGGAAAGRQIISSRKREAFLEAEAGIPREQRTREIRKNAAKFLQDKADGKIPEDITQQEIINLLMPSAVEEADAVRKQYVGGADATQKREGLVSGEREGVTEEREVSDETSLGDSLRQEGQTSVEEQGQEAVAPPADEAEFGRVQSIIERMAQGETEWSTQDEQDLANNTAYVNQELVRRAAPVEEAIAPELNGADRTEGTNTPFEEMPRYSTAPQTAAEIEQELTTEQPAQAFTAPTGPKVTPVAAPTGSKAADQITAFMGKLGITPEWASITQPDGTSAQGMYLNGKVYLNPAKFSDSFRFTGSHEIVHHIEKNMPELYAELATLAEKGKGGQAKSAAMRNEQRVIASAIEKAGGELQATQMRVNDPAAWNALVAEVQKEQGAALKGEQVADLVGELFNNEQSMEMFAKKASPTLFRRTMDRFLEILDTAIATFDPDMKEYRDAVRLRKAAVNVIQRAAKRAGTPQDGVASQEDGVAKLSTDPMSEKKEIYALRNLLTKEKFNTTYIQASTKQKEVIDSEVKKRRVAMAVSSAFVPETPQQAPKKLTPKEGAPTDVRTELYTSPVRRNAFGAQLFDATATADIRQYGNWLRERVTAPGGNLELEYLREELAALGYPVSSAREVYAAVQAEVAKEVASRPRFSTELVGPRHNQDKIYMPESKMVEDLQMAYGHHDGKRSRSAIVMMNPRDFLALATEGGEYLAARVKEYGKFSDEAIAKGGDIPVLYVDEAGKISGHEGRARSTMAKDASIRRVPVTLFNRDGYVDQTWFDSLPALTQEGDLRTGSRVTDKPILLTRDKSAQEILDALKTQATESLDYDRGRFERGEFGMKGARFSPDPMQIVRKGKAAISAALKAYQDASEMAKTPEQKAALANQAIFKPYVLTNILKFSPLQILISTFKSNPTIGKFLQTYDDLRSRGESEATGYSNTLMMSATQIDSKFKQQFNDVANLTSFYQMSLFDSNGKLKTASQQIGWTGLSEEDAAKETSERLIALATKKWEDANMTGKTGRTFTQAHNDVVRAIEALAKSPQSLKAYRAMSKHMNAMHWTELTETRKMFEDSAGVTSLRAELKGETNPARKADLEALLSEAEKKSTRLMSYAGISAGRLYGDHWPLARHGQYFVTVKSNDPADEAAGIGYEVYSFESVLEQKLAANRLRNEKGAEYTVHDFTAESTDFAGSVPQSFMNSINSIVDKEIAREEGKTKDRKSDEEIKTMKEQAAKVKEQVAKQWLMSRPETSAARRGQSRKTVLGYNEDALRAAVNYTVSSGKRIAYLKYGRHMETALAEGRDAVKKQGGDDVLESSILEDLKLRAEQAIIVDTTALHSLITKATSMWLMSSPSAFFVQMSQPFVVGLPRLAAEFGGMGKAMGAMQRGITKAFSMKDIEQYYTSDEPQFKRIRNAFNIATGQVNFGRDEQRTGEVLTDTQRVKMALDFLKGSSSGVELATAKEKLLTMMAIHRGVLSLTQFNEALDIKKGREGTGLSDMALWFMRHGEEKSRLTTFYATFELASKKLGGTEAENFVQAFNKSLEVTTNVLGDYSKESKGVMLQKATPRVLLQFQYFKVLMLFRYGEVIRDAIKGADAETQARARSELKYFLFTSSALAGLAGGPAWMLISGWNMVAAMWNTLFGDDDEPPVDTEAQVKEGLRRVLGDYMGNIAIHGPMAGLGANVTDRISPISDLNPLGGAPSWLAADKQMDYVAANKILGPGWSTLGDFVKGAEELSDGDVLNGLLHMSPKVFKDFFKVAKVNVEGGVRGSDGVMLKKIENFEWGGADIILQSIGLQPLEYSIPKERAGVVMRLTREAQAASGKLNKALDKAVRSGNADEVRQALQRIGAYNIKNPQAPITSARSTIMNAYKEQAGIKAPSRLRAEAYYAERGIIPPQGE